MNIGLVYIIDRAVGCMPEKAQGRFMDVYLRYKRYNRLGLLMNHFEKTK